MNLHLKTCLRNPNQVNVAKKKKKHKTQMERETNNGMSSNGEQVETDATMMKAPTANA